MRPKLNYANVVSTLCLFLLLGGVAYAAKQLPKNSVGTKQLKKNAVNSSKVKNHSLGTVDFKNEQLPAGPQGTAGPQGPPGPKGQDATKLFAYISDGSNPAVHTATVIYGNGVTSVSDPGGNGTYTVTFNQSLVNCVIQVEVGAGNPKGSEGAAYNLDGIPTGNSLTGNDTEAEVAIYSPTASNFVDSAFFITAFC